MNISNSDAATLLRYLDGAAQFYDVHAVSTRDVDRARLIRKLLTKLQSKYDKERISDHPARTVIDFGR